ncbi:YhcN/YlaJ family sporulation lipoprotein [Cohnella sp.]|uniref:YhcN/YlaJ family sporulation lipoprotein n=1 Tax=Cohnella sp. TaxID=1883426 RepID=UPI0035661002
MKKISIFVLATLCIFLAGCMNNQDNQNNQGQMRQQTAQNNRGNANQQQNQLGNADHRIQVADRAAKKITDLNGVRQANVLVTQRTAYVAAMLDNDQQLSRQIEDQIAQQVRAVDRNVQNVYVSTNPDFTDRINNYVNDVQQGRPVAGFFEEFNEMVQRIFPNAR